MTVASHDPPKTYGGFCRDCGRTHALAFGGAHDLALDMMEHFRATGRLDYDVPDSDADPRLALKRLFPGDRGQMFGVLDCVDSHGNEVSLRAFSSLHEGIRHVNGWVPPVLSESNFTRTLLPGQHHIKHLTRLLRALPPRSARWIELRDERRAFSKALMATVHDLYALRNVRGEVRPLRDVFTTENGELGRPPGGVGDCCAPKLLNHAAGLGLIPRGLAEFYWGASNGPEAKMTGHFYSACESRCRPILGFMLCGLDDDA